MEVLADFSRMRVVHMIIRAIGTPTMVWAANIVHMVSRVTRVSKGNKVGFKLLGVQGNLIRRFRPSQDISTSISNHMRMDIILQGVCKESIV